MATCQKIPKTCLDLTCHCITYRRFDIRTPPSPDHLSTAECIATVLREVEGESNKDIFDVLMRPLDLMVSQWRSFARRSKDNSKYEK